MRLTIQVYPPYLPALLLRCKVSLSDKRVSLCGLVLPALNLKLIFGNLAQQKESFIHFKAEPFLPGLLLVIDLIPIDLVGSEGGVEGTHVGRHLLVVLRGVVEINVFEARGKGLKCRRQPFIHFYYYRVAVLVDCLEPGLHQGEGYVILPWADGGPVRFAGQVSVYLRGERGGGQMVGLSLGSSGEYSFGRKHGRFIIINPAYIDSSLASILYPSINQFRW